MQICRYLKAGELRGKTDVYSFGIVLLQLITSRPTCAVDGNKRHINIADWVREMLSEGGSGISSVIDSSIRGHCDLVAVLKVAEREDVHARPTMTEVVAELEALQQRDDGASSAAGTSCSSAMAEDDETAVAGAHEVVQLAEPYDTSAAV
jgi:hypothetical protein